MPGLLRMRLKAAFYINVFGVDTKDAGAVHRAPHSVRGETLGLISPDGRKLSTREADSAIGRATR